MRLVELTFPFLSSFAIAAIVVGTVLRWRWGLSLAATHCPKCETKLPAIRKPTSLDQTLWGGWTCPSCGCDVDKWGRPISQ